MFKCFKTCFFSFNYDVKHRPNFVQSPYSLAGYPKFGLHWYFVGNDQEFHVGDRNGGKGRNGLGANEESYLEEMLGKVVLSGQSDDNSWTVEYG